MIINENEYNKGRDLDFISFFRKIVTYMYTSIQFYLNQKKPPGISPRGFLIKCGAPLR